MGKRFLKVYVAFTGLPAVISPSLAQDAANGKELARLHCSRCHVMPDLNNMGIGSTPSFKIMVQSKADDWRAKFEAFFSLPPHPAFVTIKELRTQRQGPSTIAPVILSLHDVDDLMTYVDELAAKYRDK